MAVFTTAHQSVCAHQVECSPEDKAVQDIIAHGDAILKRLYHTSQDRMQELAAPSACSICNDSNHKYVGCLATIVLTSDIVLPAYFAVDSKFSGQQIFCSVLAVACRSGECCEPQTDPLLTRMEDADATLRALYSAT